MKPATPKKIIPTMLFLILFCSASVYAWEPGGRHHWNRTSDDRPEGCFNLTDEQRKELAALRQQFIDDTAEIRIALNTATKNLDILLQTSEPDEKAIKALIKEITDLRATLMEKRIFHQLEVKQIAPGLARGKIFRSGQKDHWHDMSRHGRGFDLHADFHEQ